MNRFRKTDGRSRGFSLIEVTIAMAIAAVGVVTLLGMIPQGMSTMRDAGDEAIKGRIHQQVLNELQMTPYESKNSGGVAPLDSFDGLEFFYDAQGEELSDSKNQAKVPEERKKGSMAHIYSARVSVPGLPGGGGGGNVPPSAGGAEFPGYTFGEGTPNPFVRPVIVEIAAVGGNGGDFDWNLEQNFHLISTYQSVVVKMGQDYQYNP
ncbi:MAG TPA: Verru_Chthon cassette protein B [Bacteroidia bacterium]|nr:Verru_Chthon cassette protein B [Bacteroidia bacterium]